MNPLDYAYIPVIALINLAIIAVWQIKVRKISFKGLNDWFWLYACSFLNTWGIDTLARVFATHTWMDVFKVSLGAWLLFSAATAFKYYRMKSLGLKEFWLDYGGDLVSYFFIGVAVYVCT